MANDNADDFDGQIKTLKKWIEKRQETVYGFLFPVAVFSTTMGLFLLGYTTGHLQMGRTSATMLAGIFVASLIGFVVMTYWLWRTSRSHLYRRCKGLLKAMAGYRGRMERFAIWRRAVAFGQAEDDPGWSASHQEFMKSARILIDSALIDFWHSVEIDQLQREFAKRHPSSEQEEAGLGEMVSALRSPMDPPVVAVHPKVRIEYDQALVELARERTGEDELASKINALPQHVP
jgi:hypothetical protein